MALFFGLNGGVPALRARVCCLFARGATDPALAAAFAAVEAKHRSSSSSNAASGEVAPMAPAAASVDTKAYRFLDGGGKLFEVAARGLGLGGSVVLFFLSL